MPPPTAAAPYRLRRRLLLVVSLLVALVLMSAAGTVVTALASRGAILEAHALEVASRRAALLSVVAREQYIHEAHTIILRDRSHVGHHDEWVEKLNSELGELRADVNDDGKARLDELGRESRDLKAIFSTAILPAIDRQDWDEVRRAHERANALVDAMTEHADALATYFDERAMQAEQKAKRIGGLALGLAIAVGAVAAIVALFSGRGLWRSFSAPLGSLERVAERVATGDRRARVEPVAAIELAVVADAFNRMLDTLARAEAEVVSSERLAAIGRVAAGVAHEINNPIAVIRGYVKTMRQETQDEGLREELGILDEEATACQRIADDLLTYARSPALTPQPVDARELLADAVERCDHVPSRRSEEPHRARLIVEAEPAVISVDAVRIRQVIVNLVTNAREATRGEEPVIVKGLRRGDGYQIEILDRGIGISPEAREHLFEPFFTTRRDGTGLGLAVCYGLVTSHGGTIRAEPRTDGGSRFVIDLPGVVAGEEAEDQEL